MCSLWYEVINSVILQWTDRNQDTFFFWVIAVCSATIFQLPVLPSAFLLLLQLFISLPLCILQLGCELFFLPPPSLLLITPASPSFLLMPGGRVHTERNKEKVHLMFTIVSGRVAADPSESPYGSQTLSNFDFIFWVTELHSSLWFCANTRVQLTECFTN